MAVTITGKEKSAKTGDRRRPVKENLPRSNHHCPAREDRAKCHKDHAQRRDVEHAEKKIRRVPQRNKGERHESQKRDELDAKQINIRKRVPRRANVVAHRRNGCVGGRDRHPLLHSPNDVTPDYRSVQLLLWLLAAKLRHSRALQGGQDIWPARSSPGPQSLEARADSSGKDPSGKKASTRSRC